MSRFGTVLGGSANAVGFVVQGATPEALLAALGSALAATFGLMLDPQITSITLTGAGDGHMFFLEVQGAESSNAAGGIIPSTSRIQFFLGADSEVLTKELLNAQTPLPILDVQIAGAAKGQRVMGLVVSGILIPSVTRASPLFDESTAVGGTVPGTNVDTIVTPLFNYTALSGVTQFYMSVAGDFGGVPGPGPGEALITLTPYIDGVALSGASIANQSYVQWTNPPVGFIGGSVQGVLNNPGTHTFQLFAKYLDPSGAGAFLQQRRYSVILQDIG
jgi:hypothetical protein